MSIRRVAGTHLIDGGREEAGAAKDVRIFGEETEDEPGHEVVHVMAAIRGGPILVILEQLDVEAVEPAGGFDVKRVLADLPDGSNAGQREEEAEVVGEVWVSAGDCFAIDDVFGLEGFPVRGEDEFSLLLGGGGTLPQRGKSRGHLAFTADLEVNIVPLQNTARQIGLVRSPAAQPLNRCFLVSERFEKRERKFFSYERSASEVRHCLFNFNGVHAAFLASP